MTTSLLHDWATIETADEVTAPDVENAAGYTLKSDLRAGQCPSSTYPKKERGKIICVQVTPC
jgi:hypothetical protein